MNLRAAAEHPIVERLDGLAAVDPERPGSAWKNRREGDGLVATREVAGEVEEYVLD